jgi:hypothetical protein
VDRRPVGRRASELAGRSGEIVKGQGGDSEALLQRSPGGRNRGELHVGVGSPSLGHSSLPGRLFIAILVVLIVILVLIAIYRDLIL